MRSWTAVVGGLLLACASGPDEVDSAHAGGGVGDNTGGNAAEAGSDGGSAARVGAAGAVSGGGTAGSGGRGAAGGSGGTAGTHGAGTGGVAGAGGSGGETCGSDFDLRGLWREEFQLTCDGQRREPDQRINEFLFSAGQIYVTWRPFETYVDYWGPYEAVPGAMGTGTLSFEVESSNFLPDDVDAEGTYTLCGDTLVLEDMWLGTYWQSDREPGCGHVFRRPR